MSVRLLAGSNFWERGSGYFNNRPLNTELNSLGNILLCCTNSNLMNRKRNSKRNSQFSRVVFHCEFSFEHLWPDHHEIWWDKKKKLARMWDIGRLGKRLPPKRKYFSTRTLRNRANGNKRKKSALTLSHHCRDHAAQMIALEFSYRVCRYGVVESENKRLEIIKFISPFLVFWEMGVEKHGVKIKVMLRR